MFKIIKIYFCVEQGKVCLSLFLYNIYAFIIYKFQTIVSVFYIVVKIQLPLHTQCCTHPA